MVAGSTLPRCSRRLEFARYVDGVEPVGTPTDDFELGSEGASDITPRVNGDEWAGRGVDNIRFVLNSPAVRFAGLCECTVVKLA